MSTTKVSADLAAILEMAERLEQRAIDLANDRMFPGGEALVNLAAVADMTIWERRNELADDALIPFEDPDEIWSPYQTLRFWSEQWRIDLDMDHEDPSWRPSIKTEAAFLRNADVLEWAYSDPHFDDFARDVAMARRKLEDVLHEGTRVAQRGVPCMYDECRRARIVRVTVPTRDKDGNKTWRLTDWHCPRCKRSWSEDDYARLVTAQHERTKFEDIDGAMWASIDYAARQVGRPARTLKTWVTRGELATLCLIAGRRLPFVSLDEVRELADGKPMRRRVAPVVDEA